MKKLVLPTVLSGLFYAFVVFAGAALCQGRSLAVSSLGFGATLGVLLHLTDIPRTACGCKTLSARFFLTMTLFAASALLGLAAMKAVWPSVTYADSIDFVWALLGTVAATVLISIARRCSKMLNAPAPN